MATADYGRKIASAGVCRLATKEKGPPVERDHKRHLIKVIMSHISRIEKEGYRE